MILNKKNYRLNELEESEDWSRLLDNAKSIRIDNKFVNKMLNNFDQEK